MIASLTPTRDEAWIVGFTGAVNGGYFDVCCYLDQHSADGTQDIIRRLPKALLRPNDSPMFNEAGRQLQLIALARELRCACFVALDADEALLGSPEAFRAELQALAPGAAVHYEWINIAPDGEHCWSAGFKRLGFVDDGAPHRPVPFHSERVPEGRRAVRSQPIRVAHLQYLNPARFFAKHVGYLERELGLDPGLSRVDLYRKYSHMLYAELRPLREDRELAALLEAFRAGAAMAGDAPAAPAGAFVRGLRQADEWLLLDLLARLARFAGLHAGLASLGPPPNLIRRAALRALDLALRKPHALPARALLRLLRRTLG